MLLWKEPFMSRKNSSYHLYDDINNIHYVFCGGEDYSEINPNNKTVTLRTLEGTLIKQNKKTYVDNAQVIAVRNYIHIKRSGVRLKCFPRLNFDRKLSVREVFKELKAKDTCSLMT